jgi:hypothetical protein
MPYSSQSAQLDHEDNSLDEPAPPSFRESLPSSGSIAIPQEKGLFHATNPEDVTTSQITRDSQSFAVPSNSQQPLPAPSTLPHASASNQPSSIPSPPFSTALADPQLREASVSVSRPSAFEDVPAPAYSPPLPARSRPGPSSRPGSSRSSSSNDILPVGALGKRAFHAQQLVITNQDESESPRPSPNTQAISVCSSSPADTESARVSGSLAQRSIHISRTSTTSAGSDATRASVTKSPELPPESEVPRSAGVLSQRSIHVSRTSVINPNTPPSPVHGQIASSPPLPRRTGRPSSSHSSASQASVRPPAAIDSTTPPLPVRQSPTTSRYVAPLRSPAPGFDASSSHTGGAYPPLPASAPPGPMSGLMSGSGIAYNAPQSSVPYPPGKNLVCLVSISSAASDLFSFSLQPSPLPAGPKLYPLKSTRITNVPGFSISTSHHRNTVTIAPAPSSAMIPPQPPSAPPVLQHNVPGTAPLAVTTPYAAQNVAPQLQAQNTGYIAPQSASALRTVQSADRGIVSDVTNAVRKNPNLVGGLLGGAVGLMAGAVLNNVVDNSSGDFGSGIADTINGAAGIFGGGDNGLTTFGGGDTSSNGGLLSGLGDAISSAIDSVGSSDDNNTDSGGYVPDMTGGYDPTAQPYGDLGQPYGDLGQPYGDLGQPYFDPDTTQSPTYDPNQSSGDDQAGIWNTGYQQSYDQLNAAYEQDEQQQEQQYQQSLAQIQQQADQSQQQVQHQSQQSQHAMLEQLRKYEQQMQHMQEQEHKAEMQRLEELIKLQQQAAAAASQGGAVPPVSGVAPQSGVSGSAHYQTQTQGQDGAPVGNGTQPGPNGYGSAQPASSGYQPTTYDNPQPAYQYGGSGTPAGSGYAQSASGYQQNNYGGPNTSNQGHGASAYTQPGSGAPQYSPQHPAHHVQHPSGSGYQPTNYNQPPHPAQQHHTGVSGQHQSTSSASSPPMHAPGASPTYSPSAYPGGHPPSSGYAGSNAHVPPRPTHHHPHHSFTLPASQSSIPAGMAQPHQQPHPHGPPRPHHTNMYPQHGYAHAPQHQQQYPHTQHPVHSSSTPAHHPQPTHAQSYPYPAHTSTHHPPPNAHRPQNDGTLGQLGKLAKAGALSLLRNAARRELK